MTIINSISRGGFTIQILLWTAVAGLIAGLIFSLIIDLAAKRLFKKITIEIPEGERVIKEAGANHFKGKESVGGKLVLTDKRLIFKSHKMNILNHQDSIELAQINNINATKILNLFNTGLTIDLLNNEKHKFVVDEPSEWVSSIELQKKTG